MFSLITFKKRYKFAFFFTFADLLVWKVTLSVIKARSGHCHDITYYSFSKGFGIGTFEIRSKFRPGLSYLCIQTLHLDIVLVFERIGHINCGSNASIVNLYTCWNFKPSLWHWFWYAPQGEENDEYFIFWDEETVMHRQTCILRSVLDECLEHYLICTVLSYI